MTLRRSVLAGVGLSAAGAGLAWQWWRAAPAARPAADPAAAAPPDLWQMRFERPGGGEIGMADLRGKPMVLNFWATWCPPCVEEMPLLDRFAREHAAAGWQVMGVAVDNAAPVTKFLAAHPVGFAIGLAGMQGVELSRQLGNPRGGLPFSVVFDRRGEVVERKVGTWTWEALQNLATRVG